MLDDLTSDLTFITNENNKSLLDRFKVLIKDTHYFDVLVGYFYTSAFYALYKSLESTEKIRILIGIDTNKNTAKLIEQSNDTKSLPSHARVKEEFEKTVAQEMEESEDSANVEEGIYKFIEWLQKGKLEIRAYPTRNIHAKLYIMTFKEGDRDIGRVITGSSNFTQSGLKDNLEFNVELKNKADYEFALQKFNELWKVSVDVKDRYIETVQRRTWLNDTITPYELYLKFLYEYFKYELSQSDDIYLENLPKEFVRYKYQEQAVLNAKRILQEYGGVFLSDVVGLGKTFMAAMLVRQLSGRTYVIAPPALIDRKNPGSWPNVFSDFNLPADFGSIGKLDDVLDEIEKREYENIIVDESHRFRTQTTIGYEKLAQICRGKRVILVSATPYNNSPNDILSQIKLFQHPTKSTIPNLPNLEAFFNRLDKRLNAIDKHKDYKSYLEIVKDNAREIREKVLKYIMVRRTRREIEKYFKADIEKQKLKFPEVQDPIPMYYQLNQIEDKIFNETIKLIAQDFTYARYKPLLYYNGELKHTDKIGQENMGKFMKILLVKRLESSFWAFKQSIDRFIRSYEMFIKEFDNGNVYISKKHINKIFELLENDDDEAVQKLIDEGKAEQYDSIDFKPSLKVDLQNDIEILNKIKSLWSQINRDPKLDKLMIELKNNRILKNQKIIIFTESKETAQYLTENIKDKALCYYGSQSETVRDKMIENFDAKAKNPKDDYMILVSTEVLSEGVNLHRSNIVINYDIPWNPTRMMQRVGRVNRIDTKFDKIYIFNFFPTAQSEDEINLQKTAESKINGFLTLLGGDAAILTEGEPVTSHVLFNRLISKETVLGEDDEESDLKYLNIIKDIRDSNKELFEKIKRHPKKARSAKVDNSFEPSVLTYLRLGNLDKFFITDKSLNPKELDFITAAKIFECNINQQKQKIPKDYYDMLEANKKAFIEATTKEQDQNIKTRKGKDSCTQLLHTIIAALNSANTLTDTQEEYLKNVRDKLQEGVITAQAAKKALKALDDLKQNGQIQNPQSVYNAILPPLVKTIFFIIHLPIPSLTHS